MPEITKSEKKLKEADKELKDLKNERGDLVSLSELRRELGISLVMAKKMVLWGIVEGHRAADGTIHITEEELSKAKEYFKNPVNKTKFFFKSLGPGLITGASDDDPSGIATYSSVGAQYGFGLIWMAAWILPLMIAVQEVCARIGVVTSKGLAGVMLKKYKKGWVASAVVLLIIANVINIGADLGAMAASMQLLVKVDFIVAAIVFAGIIILIELYLPYKTYVKILKWLTLSVFAYIITGIMIKPDWGLVAIETLVPEIHLNSDYLFAMVAVLGTTITPYLFFWQTSEEVEEGQLEKQVTGKVSPLKQRIARMRTDVRTGMILANIVFFFIILTTATVLFENGIHSIGSAEQAAEALRPFAGDQAYLLFALGIIGTGLLAVPILAGSGAYALSEVMKWKEGMNKGPKRAKAFYAVIAFSILFGLLFNLLGIDPIKALYYSAFINGIIAVPLLFIIMKVGDDEKIMGHETHPTWVRFFGWLTVFLMATAVIVTLALEVFF